MSKETAAAARPADTSARVITNGEVFAAHAVLPMLLGLQLSPVPSFQLARAHRKVVAAYQTLETVRMSLIRRHAQKTGKKLPDGSDELVEIDHIVKPAKRAVVVRGKITEPAEEAVTQKRVVMADQTAFDADIRALFEEPADLEGLQPISMAALGDQVMIAPAILLATDFLFVE